MSFVCFRGRVATSWDAENLPSLAAENPSPIPPEMLNIDVRVNIDVREGSSKDEGSAVALAPHSSSALFPPETPSEIVFRELAAPQASLSLSRGEAEPIILSIVLSQLLSTPSYVLGLWLLELPFFGIYTQISLREPVSEVWIRESSSQNEQATCI